MQVDKTKLIEALELVKPGLANTEVVEQAMSFVFRDGRVFTYNEEICMSHPVEGMELEGAVKAEELYKLLLKLSKNDIDITAGDNELVLKCGRVKAGIVYQPEVILPIDTIGEIGEWKDIPDTLMKAIEFVSPACNIQDMSRPLLTCVHVSENGYVEASDGFRIIRYNVKGMPIGTFLVQAVLVPSISSIRPVQIAEGEGFIHFRSEDDTIISCRIFAQDKYVNTEQFLSVKGVPVTLPKSIKKMIDTASIFNDAMIKLSFKENKLRIKSRSMNGWSQEHATIEFDGDPFSFQINPKMLLGILNQTLDCEISDKLLKFEGEDWKYVSTLTIEGD
jgi:hypothetical protein